MSLHQTPPPIQWLPVFEAAARHLSFKAAAEELCVTPPAVSQQIKVLEDYLNTQLFDRQGRSLRLTQAGSYYFRIAHNIMKQHAKGFRDFERYFHNPTLNVSSPIFIAQELLIPNYTQFKDYAPGLELRIITGNELVDFDQEAVDAAIRFGDGNWPQLDRRLLCDVELSLVCSPDYFEANFKDDDFPLTEHSLEDQTLISLYDGLRDWKEQFPRLKAKQSIIADSYFAVTRLAEEGQGIAVGLKPIINRLLKHKRLIEIPTRPIHSNRAYWLVSPQESTRAADIDAFYHWTVPLFQSLY